MVSVLEREMYAETEAARLLRLPPSTLHYWLEGGVRRNKTYKPIIRVEPREVRRVTWAEFVEAGWLREYRREQVPMPELRRFIDGMRERFAVPYPLADRRPLVTDRQLVYEAQRDAKLSPEFYLVTLQSGQMLLTPPGDGFLRRVLFDGDVATGYRPHDDPASPVRISPDVRFGRPAVAGISTEVIWEHAEAGEDVAEIAEVFELTADNVRWALSYEYGRQAA